MAESEGTKACRLCLVMESKLISIDMQLEDSMRSILGQNITYESGLPKYTCDDCAEFLRQFKEFRAKCLITQTVLYQILKTAGQVTDTEIRKLDRKRLKLDTHITPLHLKKETPTEEMTHTKDMVQEMTPKEEILLEDSEVDRRNEHALVKLEPEPLEMNSMEESESETDEKSNVIFDMFEEESEVFTKSSNPLEKENTAIEKENKKEIILPPEHADLPEGFNIGVPPGAANCPFGFPSLEEYCAHTAKHRTYKCRRCSYSATDVYLNERKNNKNKSMGGNELLDLNSNFEMNENNIEEVKIIPDEINLNNTTNVATDQVQMLSSDNQDNIQVTLNDVEGTSTVTDDILSLKTSELKVFQENNALHTENMALKEELKRSVEFQNETKKNFAVMQTQLDKMIELLLQNNNKSISFIANDGPISEDGIDKVIISDVKFPIQTKEELDALEYKLLDKDIMTYLVNKFSKTCGTSGISRISKVGLTLMKLFIKDELLNQFTWKGIKGSTKFAFQGYVKIRELFYRVAHLADKSCSFNDSDSFIQNSAIKHSGQRMKRQIMSSESKMYAKKTKREIDIIEKKQQ